MKKITYTWININVTLCVFSLLLELEITATTCSNRVEIPPMRRDIQLQRVIASVAHQIERPGVLRDVRRCRDDLIGRADVVLWTDVNET